MRNLAKLFKALSDPNRLRILKMLRIRPLCVCEMKVVLNLAASTVSKHLSVLRDAGFIYDEKESKWVNYFLNTQFTNDTIRVLLPLLSTWMPADETSQKDIELVQSVDRNKICATVFGDDNSMR